jgi:hypothetical protein
MDLPSVTRRGEMAPRGCEGVLSRIWPPGPRAMGPYPRLTKGSGKIENPSSKFAPGSRSEEKLPIARREDEP